MRLRKLILHEEKLQEDLNNTWAVVAEAIQTILRREAYPHPYEALKALTRTNQHMTEETIHEFIQGLNVSVSELSLKKKYTGTPRLTFKWSEV